MKQFRHVILWGHSLHTNTFSYVYEGMERAFTKLGIKCYWLPRDKTLLEQVEDWSIGALFIVEGTVEAGVPITDSSYYVVHNCNVGRYPASKHLVLQTYTDDVLTRATHKLNGWTFFEPATKTLYQPWATDLLPEEIGSLAPANERYTGWVGTIGAGTFGNVNELAGWRRACVTQNVGFLSQVNLNALEHRQLIRRGIMAPTICGEWQCRVGYIPCRIFKNISYGQYGMTNSNRVQEVFGGRLFHDSNTHHLFFEARRSLEKQNRQELMDIVKREHTYLNRVQRILEFL